ncbi:hypothetical protein V500_02721 [Pseudogymnoascus sp. VKM F-4518 (FW-2643)]|nr:hypothetical protein V500_02721 [Pseudogymnoascus sp. VKM F-4518 (FW-2643)]
MKSSTIISALPLLVLAPIANATCFTTGLEGDRTTGHDKVPRMCDYLAGDYAPGQAKHHAFTYSPNWYPRRWDFWITNTRNVVSHNSWDGCVEFLNREVDCLQGGETHYPTLGWTFHADPNDGPETDGQTGGMAWALTIKDHG